MTIWAVIPAKPAEEGKSRLAEVLSPPARFRLNRLLFRHSLATTLAVFAPERVIVVSRDPALRGIAAAAGAQALTEHGTGLNAALHQAALVLPAGDGLLTISTDLPSLTPEDLLAMLEQFNAVSIAPDRAGTGTNALLTSPAACIPYCFGENSFALHCAEAARIGVTPRTISRPGLAFDLDTPGDLPACPPGFLA
jgi:2-phospho-L-lactate guanylyltransferase